MAEVASPSQPQPITLRRAFQFLLLCAAIGAPMVYAADRYTVGIDNQWFRCMAEKYFVIDHHDVRDEGTLRPLDIIAFQMSEDQAMRELDWTPGETMVKRVLATEPGTVIEVTLEGVAFTEPSGRNWTFGKGLEAADILGAHPDDFVRTVVLSEGEFWAMGDMPYSVDSRYYGPVKIEQLTGTAVLKW